MTGIPLPHIALGIFVATRREDVPAAYRRWLSVDGSVPGAVRTWDHHLTGERINLDAMPPELDASDADAVGTTLADTDALVSVLAVLAGGTARLPAAVRGVLESASHWCDHLAPHPDHDAPTNAAGRRVDAYVAEALSGGRTRAAGAFEPTCRRFADALAQGAALPQAEPPEERDRQRALALLRDGRVSGSGSVTLFDLRGRSGIHPLALYALTRSAVAVLLESRSSDGGRQYTVGVNPFAPSEPRSLEAALRQLAEEEATHGPPCVAPSPAPGSENWGGRATVFGSPWNYGSRIEPERVVEILKEQVPGVD